LHSNRGELEVVFYGKFPDIFIIVVSQQKIALYGFHEGKEPFVVNFKMSVQASPGPLAVFSGRVRWINKKHCVFSVLVRLNHFKGVPLYELESISDVFQIPDSPGKGGWIPTRGNSLSILPMFHEPCTFGKDAPVGGGSGDFVPVRTEDAKNAPRNISQLRKS